MCSPALADGSLPALCHTITYDEGSAVFSVTVRDHMMVAHSLRGEVFGPAQRLHGATYVVDATFRAPTLDADGLVVDIGRAVRRPGGGRRRARLPQPRRRPDAGRRQHDDRAARRRSSPTGSPTACAAGELGSGTGHLTAIAVTLHESHVAWASYERAP